MAVEYIRIPAPNLPEAELLDAGYWHEFDAGSTYQLTRGKILIIERGVLSLEYEEGSMAAVGNFLGPGDIIGAAHALAVDERCAGSRFIAQTAVGVTVVSVDWFGEFITNQATAARALLADLAYQHYREKVCRARNILSANDRVRLFLEDTASRFGVTQSVDAAGSRRIMLKINLTQGGIARTLGVSTAAVEGALRDLRRRSLIETGRRWIMITLPASNRYLSVIDFAPPVDSRV
ncbi:MAG TPA: helix-turn-helix domain-containing protein [Pseudonocardiaceae bacterium]|nr:helix-turn-helix domain-containing protein [Pseudonocardiaceae bacterium]